MSATPSLKITKSMPFKGATRLWSNRYHFAGGTPSDQTHWHTLMDAVVAAEKALYDSDLSLVEATGYDAGSDVPVASKDYSVAGTFTGSGNLPPGEVAALVRYATAARTSKNHPVYLFNYYHHIIGNASTSLEDKLTAGSVTALSTYAGAWISGFSDGTNSYNRAGPNGASATGFFVEEYFTHRDFPYTRSA